jgi:formylglycine-generating enzyme required for sulfatase activity
VSWNDAKAYVAWLSKTTGKPYRLLSEAEREYVTRAGTTTAFWWGPYITAEQANQDEKGQYRQLTLPVDSLTPNPWGLYQVHGNAWEWFEDCYHDNYTGAPIDGSAWTSGDCIFRVLRGGSWVSIPKESSRRGSLPTSPQQPGQ